MGRTLPRKYSRIEVAVPVVRASRRREDESSPYFGHRGDRRIPSLAIDLTQDGVRSGGEDAPITEQIGEREILQDSSAPR